MGNVGEPIRRWTGVPDDEPLQLPDQFPDHDHEEAPATPVPAAPEQPLIPA